MITETQEKSIKVIVEGLSELNSTGWVEWIFNIATLIIAIVGLIISIVVFRKSRKDNEVQNNSTRKLELMKTLILDQNMSKFYDIFNRLFQCAEKLKNKTCNKEEVEEGIQSTLKELNENILLLFVAIDNTLYVSLLDESDRCRDSIVTSIGDEGINLYVEEKYKEHILKHLNLAKQQIIRKIYNYKG